MGLATIGALILPTSMKIRNTGMTGIEEPLYAGDQIL